MKRPFLALASLAISFPLAAQTATTGPLALTLPASARTLALGDIGVAGRDDDVIFYNPAQLFVARGTSFSLTRLSETSRGGTMSTVLRLGPGAVGFGVNYLEYQVAAVQYPLHLPDVLDRNFAIGTSALGSLGYAQTYRGFRLGVAAKYAMDAIDIERFGNLYGDAGIARDLRNGRYTAALSVQHFGPSLERGTENIPAPLTTTLGVSTSRPMGPLDVVATAGLSYSDEDELSGGGGAEIGWSWLSGYSIAARIGGHTHHLGQENALMGGFGFTADRMTFDFVAHQLDSKKVGYRAGIRIR